MTDDRPDTCPHCDAAIAWARPDVGEPPRPFHEKPVDDFLSGEGGWRIVPDDESDDLVWAKWVTPGEIADADDDALAVRHDHTCPESAADDWA